MPRRRTRKHIGGLFGWGKKKKPGPARLDPAFGQGAKRYKDAVTTASQGMASFPTPPLPPPPRPSDSSAPLKRSPAFKDLLATTTGGRRRRRRRTKHRRRRRRTKRRIKHRRRRRRQRRRTRRRR